jgi:AraC-binding-like domain
MVLGAAVEFVTSDPEEALEVSASLFYPHRYTAIGSSSLFFFGMKATRLEAMTVGLVSLGGEVGVQNDVLGSYHVRAPLSGRLLSKTRVAEVVASPETAAIYRPDSDTSLSCLDQNTMIWLIKFEAAVLERHLSTLLGEEASGTIDLSPSLDLTSPVGQVFWALTESLRNPFTTAAVVSMPMVSKPYVEMVANALLFCLEHRYSEKLKAPSSLRLDRACPWRSTRFVRRPAIRGRLRNWLPVRSAAFGHCRQVSFAKSEVPRCASSLGHVWKERDAIC